MPYCRAVLSEDEVTNVNRMEITSAAARYLKNFGEIPAIINFAIRGVNFRVFGITRTLVSRCVYVRFDILYFLLETGFRYQVFYNVTTRPRFPENLYLLKLAPVNRRVLSGC